MVLPAPEARKGMGGMGYWLGIDLGSTFTAAAVCREQDGRWGPPEVVALGERSAAVSSVVFLGEAGQRPRSVVRSQILIE
jgi:molecular chaperone DnaK (HSP70)